MKHSRKLVAEGVGSVFLLMAVVGSGIMGERLAAGNTAVALLANTLATGAALAVLILIFGPISGAHLNPAVTLADASQGGISWREVPTYIGVQVAGAFIGVGLANLMFSEPLYFASHHARAGAPQLLGEFIATFGLLSVIWGCVRLRPAAVPYAVAGYITAAYWFTSSTSFANPAVTLARSASDTFAGIRPTDVPGFVAAQLAGAAAATLLFRWLVPASEKQASQGRRVEAKRVCERSSATLHASSDSTTWKGAFAMRQVRVILVGGFLGSGKTTLLGRAARHLETCGERVALITNDQAPNLVDTELLRRDGFAVGEVSGGCFCCKFDALVQSLEKAISANQAGVVLGEPVGSCTDLSATVLQPLKHLYGDRFCLAPLTVLADPLRLQEAFRSGAARGFPDSVYYIFHKQLEEADAIAINKSDLISRTDLSSLESQVRERFPETPVFSMSARTGAGFDSWLAFVESGARTGQRIAKVDYDLYAEGEAVLGWLNARLQIDSAEAIDWEAFASKLLGNLRESLKELRAEAAHVKIFLTTHDGSVTANLASGAAEPVVSGDMKGKPREAGLLVNARVHTSPERLSALVERSLHVTAGDSMAMRILSLESFSPSRPQPTHRYGRIT
jgi:glycerol uptake facilitator-like aquaporin/G3E family GTPase